MLSALGFGLQINSRLSTKIRSLFSKARSSKSNVQIPMSKFQCPKSSEFGFWTLYYGLRTSDGGGGEGVVGTL